MKSSISKDYEKIQCIIHIDYSEYPKELRQFLEYRKEAYKRWEDSDNEELKRLIAYVEDKIKLILTL